MSTDETDKTKLYMLCEHNETTEHIQFIPFNLYLPFHTFVSFLIRSFSISLHCSLISHHAHIVLSVLV